MARLLPPTRRTLGGVGRREAVTVFAGDDHPVIARIQRGEGEVWLLACPEILDNGHLRLGDHLQLLSDLCAGRPVRFDEFSHGMANDVGVRESLVAWRLGPALALASIAVCLWFWRGRTLLGEPAPPPPPQRAEAIDSIGALGVLYTGAMSRSEGLDAYYRRYRRLLRARLGLDEAGSAREADRRLPSFRALDRARRRRRQAASPPPSRASTPPQGDFAMSDSAAVHDLANRLRAGLDRVVFGQAVVKERVLACLLAGGHALIEGAPGTAKTLLALALSRLIGSTFRRIQFTPDLMPIDLLGTNIFDQRSQSFTFVPGPVFTDVLLADEINRTPPRTQSALLEAMQERAVTIDSERRPLSPAFFVLATQNPIEYEGTYALPEAQKDRFLMRIDIDYPTPEDELGMLRAYSGGRPLHELALNELSPVTDNAGIVAAGGCGGGQVRGVDKLRVDIRVGVAATRADPSLQLGAGPRASLALLSVGRAVAVIRGRDFITPDDIKEIAPAVLAHRVIVSPEAEMEGVELDDVIERIFAKIEVPR